MVRAIRSLTSVCPECGTVFKVMPSAAARGAGIYCSVECRRDFHGYRRLIEAVMPGTIRELADKSRLSVPLVRDNVKRMLRANRWHIDVIVDLGYRGLGVPRFEPVIAIGPAVHADMPRDTRGAVSFYMEQLILMVMPARLQEIVDVTTMGASTVLRLVNGLRQRESVFVSGWSRALRGEPVEVFSIGNSKDVPCRLKKYTQSQKNSRYREKLKREGKMDEKLARGRSYYWKKKAASRGDGMIGMLFGRAGRHKPEQENGLHDNS